MKAATHDTFGEPVEVLASTEVEKPAPAAGEVLVKMTFSPIHNHDLWTVHGSYGYKPELPGAIGGSEGAELAAAAAVSLAVTRSGVEIDPMDE